MKAQPDALRLVARNGAGSMRDALSLLDRLISGLDAGETLTTDKVTALLGLPPMQRVFELVEAIGEGDPKAALARAERILSAGQSADSMVGALIDHLHALLVRNVAGGGELSELPGLDDAAVAEQAGKFEPAMLSQNIAILEELRRQMRSSAAGRALLDATLVRLALASQFTPVAELLAAANGAPPRAGAEKKTPQLAAQGGNASRGTGYQPVPGLPSRDAVREVVQGDPPLAEHGLVAHATGADAPRQLEVEAANVRAVSAGEVSDLAELWSRLREVMRAQKESLSALLEGGWIERIDLTAGAGDAGMVEIVFDAPHAPLASMLERNGKKEQVAEAVGTLLGLPRAPAIYLRVLKAEPAPPSQPPARAREQRSRPVQDKTSPSAAPPNRVAETSSANQNLESDPLVAAAIRELGARIVKVEDQ